MRQTVIIIVAVICAAVIAWALWLGRDAGGPVEAPAAVEPEPTPRPVPEPEVVVPVQVAEPEPAPPPEPPLPELPDSDPYVLEQLPPGALPEDWVAQGDYVRRLTVIAENATRGEYPRRQLGFLAPQGPFQVIERDDRVFMDPASYRRYDPYLTQLEAIDPEQLAGLLASIDPLMQDALAEIGVVDAPPDQVLAAAIREVLEVPILEGDVELVQPNVMYHFADPKLEALSPLKKQVLRMGPDNVRRLQDYLRAVAAGLNLVV